MGYFRICPGCGAKLDPGEPCEECREQEKAVDKLTFIINAEYKQEELCLETQ